MPAGDPKETIRTGQCYAYATPRRMRDTGRSVFAIRPGKC